MEVMDEQTQPRLIDLVNSHSKVKERKILSYEISTEKKSNREMEAEQTQIKKEIEEEILDICLNIFPHPNPYESQVESMKKIIKSLQEKKNLLFQSPTGTGKTLVTICSALAYIEKNPKTQVLVLTRTNEQINGFIKEIRKINKYPSINRYAVLAGRGQFCLYLKQFKENFEKQKLQQSKFNKHLTEFCNQKHSKKKKKQQGENEAKCDHPDLSSPNMSIFSGNSYVDLGLRVFQNEKEQSNCSCCPHYKIYKQLVKSLADKKSSVKEAYPFPYVRNKYDQPHHLPDIEDMKDLFEQKELGCPFFFNKLAAQSAKIIFSTYNYVIKQNILGTIKDLFEGEVIVIFDEAHNISDQAEQEQKVKLQSKHWEQLNTTLKQMQKIFSKQQQMNSNFQKVNQTIRDLIKQDVQLESIYFIEMLQKKVQDGESTDSDSEASSDEDEDSDEEDDDIEKEKKPMHAKYNKQTARAEQKPSKRKFLKNMDFINDTYDKISKKIFSRQDLPPNSPDNLKQISDYIDKVRREQNYSVVEMEEVFAIYQDERIKEIFSFLDSIQHEFLSINEDCEGLQYFFNEQNQKKIKLFCSLFTDQDISKHFEDLNVTDTKHTQKFLDRIITVYNMLSYLKKVLLNFIQKQDPSKENKNVESIFVVENGSAYEATSTDVNMVKKVAEEIKLKYFQKIWNFFHKLLKLRKEFNIKDNPKYLQDHYLSLVRNENIQSFIPYFEIGCLSASYLFEKINQKLKISSLILTSGTLEPFELIEKCLGIPFSKYSAPHIINSQTNLFTQFITTFNDVQISFSKKSMDEEEQRDTILHNSQLAINTILKNFKEYTNKVNKKSGIVIFFKSYQMLNSYYNLVGHILSKDCNIYRETRDANEFKNLYLDYKEKILSNRINCIFLAVNRGKLSEGIDLKDELCRVVILYGVPYPHLYDPYIICKRKHAQLYLGESQWYKKETVKVVNQAAGRCIRYKEDWGCIFFLDEQYKSESNIYAHISKWVLEGQKTKKKVTDSQWVELLQQFLIDKSNELLQKE